MKFTAGLTLLLLGFFSSRATVRADSLPLQEGIYTPIDVPG
jgi:hypothetical protein